MFIASCRADRGSDWVLENGAIYTVDPGEELGPSDRRRDGPRAPDEELEEHQSRSRMSVFMGRDGVR
jgi:hypothetical protein